MSLYTHKNKDLLNRIERIDITEYIREGIFALRRKGYGFHLSNNFYEYNRLQDLLNDPKNTTFKSMRDFQEGYYYWDKQEVDLVPSNLGQGFIFYFRCNSCRRRVKYLYRYDYCYEPVCRTCCRLKYTYPSKRGKGLSRLLRKSYLSSEDKKWIIRYAEITKEDLV